MRGFASKLISLNEEKDAIHYMKIYNSLTRQKEDFVPREPGKVKMYTCGPTVYHFAHIGNLRTYIMEDVLEKYLRYTGLEVERVMNITDVGHLSSDADTGEDKMLAGARRESKTAMEIAKRYTEAFFDDCDRLNIRRPDTVVPATSCIDEFIDAVGRLIDKGFAYFAGGNVYFDTSKLDEYNVFHNHEEEDLEVGVRAGVEADKNKRNKTDFVLWFTKSKFEDQELKWPSPWGMGYPGWHIECTCISIKYLGEHLDIHCGGIDNMFPHHTNEIAQSEALLGHKWCNYWVHSSHLVSTGAKMSKSKGEFLTLPLIESKGYDPMVYRLFCLQSHYRKFLSFTYEGLDNAASAYKKLISRIAALEKGGQESDAEMEPFRQAFLRAMDDDLGTANALTALYDALKAPISDASKRALTEDFDSVLSLGLMERAEASDSGEGGAEGPGDEIEQLIEARRAAREARDFKEADRIRDQLKAMGIELEDTPAGVKWHRA